MTQNKIENQTRERISAFLPDAIAQALTSYHRFADQNVPEDAKGFSAHHGACKVAIAHIELLIKLARWADLPDAKTGDPNNQIMLAVMMQEAEEELSRYRARGGSGGRGGRGAGDDDGGDHDDDDYNDDDGFDDDRDGTGGGAR